LRQFFSFSYQERLRDMARRSLDNLLVLHIVKYRQGANSILLWREQISQINAPKYR
jgi:hypothetical protein